MPRRLAIGKFFHPICPLITSGFLTYMHSRGAKSFAEFEDSLGPLGDKLVAGIHA